MMSNAQVYKELARMASIRGTTGARLLRSHRLSVENFHRLRYRLYVLMSKLNSHRLENDFFSDGEGYPVDPDADEVARPEEWSEPETAAEPAF